MGLCFYQRLSLAAIVTFILLTSGFLYWSNQVQSLIRSEAEQRLHLNLAQHLVNDNPLLQQGMLDYSALSNLFHTLMVMGPNFEFYLVDPQGKILTHSQENGAIARNSISIEPIHELIADNQSLPIFGDNPKQDGQKKIFSAAEVQGETGLIGYLYVIIGGEKYDSILQKLSHDRNYTQFTLLGVASLTLFLISLMVLFKFLTQPMKRLTLAMQAVIKADYDLNKSSYERYEWNRNSQDEIQKLGCAFNNMVDHIQNQYDKLQNLDNTRRGLLADLSHDLRTPLANMQGYMETLAINEHLSNSDRKRFTQIALKNAQNLKHLIDQIFELAYLDSGQVSLNAESFPIAELLHDIASKFAMAAEHKDISIKVEIGKLDTTVFADIGKLERVLSNLLDNAIRHTPNRGAIKLSAHATQTERVKIKVCDNGIGIKAEELNMIFDTRFQASNTAQDDKLHTGIGLATCSKLVGLMGSNLSVESELGKGTEFSFKLPTTGKTND